MDAKALLSIGRHPVNPPRAITKPPGLTVPGVQPSAWLPIALRLRPEPTGSWLHPSATRAIGQTTRNSFFHLKDQLASSRS